METKCRNKLAQRLPASSSLPLPRCANEGERSRIKRWRLLPAWGWLLLLALVVALPALAQKKQGSTLMGKVVTAEGKRPLPYAVVILEELRLTATAAENGDYRFDHLPHGTYSLRVRCLGYAQQQQTVKVDGLTKKDIALESLSLHLAEVQVMGQASNQAEGSIKITNEAIQHIQPSNLRDLFQLLPGQLTHDGTMAFVTPLSLRQSGADANTGLGMSLLLDGVPLSNNANLQALAGDRKLAARSTVGEGTDLRLLSTDHLQEVEVVQGISSAEYGDLSSGMVLTKAKTGVTPWEARMKADATTKLVYLGKGFRIGRWGTLHAGIDYTYATPRKISDLDNYTRITGQVTHQIRRTLWGRSLHSDTKISFIATLDRSKNDPDLTQGLDTYRANYTRLMVSTNGRWGVGLPWLQRLDYTFSIDQAADRLVRSRTISLFSPTPLPLSTEEGEHEGIYLPNYYTSDYRVEGRPFSFYGAMKGSSVHRWGQTTHSLRAGVDFRLDKNYGAGSLYAIETPPSPQSKLSSRPRRFDAIPAEHHWAFFVEDKVTAVWKEHSWQVVGGLRATLLGNLPKEYTALRGQWQVEPRLNALWRLPRWQWGAHSSQLSFRGGFGQQVKQPTLSMLYPEMGYFDYISANYFSQQKENAFLWVTTRKRPTENYRLTSNRNTKWEIGAEWQVDKMTLWLTLFQEISTSGFEAQNEYFTTRVNRYQTDRLFPQKPTIADFTQYADTFLDSYSMTVNAAKLVKQGIEYRLLFPRIRPLQTSIEINGAYYRTTYDVSLPVTYRPTVVLQGRPFPYVGYYSWDRSKVRQRFNTNLWLHTHLPRYGLVFSTVVQFLWDSRSRQLPFDGRPTHYMGLDGKRLPFTSEAAADPLLRQLVQRYPATFFEPDISPIEWSVNMKVSKEIGKIATLSFFANRLFFHRGAALSKLGLPLSRRGTPAVFGTELRLRL